MIDTRTPSSFKQRESGLYVPDALSRDRQVFTRDELRLIDRALALLGKASLKLQMACEHPRCADSRGKVERKQLADGSVVLQCDHLDRTFMRAF